MSTSCFPATRTADRSGFPSSDPSSCPPWAKIYPEGFYQLNRMQLYVNRGIGTVGMPFRLNCPPEITLLTLQPA